MNRPSDGKTPHDETALAPWVHPKAKVWFSKLFEQSGLIMQLRDVLDNPEQPIAPEEARILMAVVTILAQQGIWPEGQRKDLQRLSMRLGKLVREKSDANGGKALTMGEHKRQKAFSEEVEKELEFLRRIAGVSNRVSDIYMPASWGQFWT